MMTEADVASKVQEHFGARVLEAASFRGQHRVTVAPADIRDVLIYLRDQLGFEARRLFWP